MEGQREEMETESVREGKRIAREESERGKGVGAKKECVRLVNDKEG